MSDDTNKTERPVPIIGPSQSGKSAAIGHSIDKVVTPSAFRAAQGPQVLRINSSPRTSLRQFYEDILKRTLLMKAPPRA